MYENFETLRLCLFLSSHQYQQSSTIYTTFYNPFVAPLVIFVQLRTTKNPLLQIAPHPTNIKPPSIGQKQLNAMGCL